MLILLKVTFTRFYQDFYTPRKVSKYGVISGPYFPVIGPEITPYLDTFHAVICIDVK